ncbi:lipopolysaccharide assembly protein LapA domain-containing protein [Sphingomonas sp. LaA6.9]|uniref:lipopolysaccharide assembly protein LapA domain-containing protein n=1 Tax=Sphingomonas sp. LaA6.9 TaxID=2919914 RepID=UPI001F4F8593|nr:lipopolysaccharide assembly protein LapA domain-containing protein [Sphingomonas sp. LaA6.9]MCJ8157635.1 hypothetical protein [Sphingomonas sp. LaA6.9]
MQFLRTIFWVILAVTAVIFAVANWTSVTINLWGDIQVDSKLPVLLFGAFLLGLVPTLILHRATRWRLKRKLDSTERALADARGLSTTPAAPAVEPDMPPAYVPTAVPPGVS